MSAKREKIDSKKNLRPKARCGRDARGPSKSLDEQINCPVWRNFRPCGILTGF